MGAVLSRVQQAKEKMDNDDVEEAGGDGNHQKPSLLSRHAGKIVVSAFVAYTIILAELSEVGCGGGGLMDVAALAVWMFGVLLSISVMLVLTFVGMLVVLARHSDGNGAFEVPLLLSWSHHRCLVLMCVAALALGVVSTVVALSRPANGGMCRDAFGVDTMNTTWCVRFDFSPSYSVPSFHCSQPLQGRPHGVVVAAGVHRRVG